jgi:hypothetical protein
MRQGLRVLVFGVGKVVAINFSLGSGLAATALAQQRTPRVS